MQSRSIPQSTRLLLGLYRGDGAARLDDGCSNDAGSHLEVHLLGLLLALQLGPKVVEDGRRVQVHLLEHVRRLLVVNLQHPLTHHGKVERARLRVRVTERVGKDKELVMGQFTPGDNAVNITIIE
ncbi:hypothetical protein PRIPAC_93558 [Pristionchus pacificus]|uniref:Uncharacterized protein n=1 Tax=Pristionchus pacificus TaxID=54126 RepID=A0A2A6CHG8_PRIPA|nr:hypothetical protein PRIPAC_93558 [Pristionchus pacificus]|eukprot:PDM77518.1 hypothetical protein PRIPAC_34385 [Pristionchus pacificus]